MEMTPEKIGLLNAESLLLLRVKRLNKWGTNVGEFYVQQVKTWCGSSAQHLHSDVDRNIWSNSMLRVCVHKHFWPCSVYQSNLPAEFGRLPQQCVKRKCIYFASHPCETCLNLQKKNVFEMTIILDSF